MQNPAGEGSCHFEDEHTLFISLAPRPIHYLQAQDGKTHTGLYRQGDISITPANTPLFVRWEGDEHCLQIQLSDRFVKSVAQETLEQDCDRIHLIPEFQTRTPQLESISMMLLNERQQETTSRLYIDSLANILAVNLLRQHATTKARLPVYEGGLPQRQLLHVLDYIDAHLAEDIKLADLARLLDMSQFHFSRLFKQSLGVSPYQYLLQQRVERAKRLLKQTDRLITNIALDCGFNSHSHLSKQFRQLTGMTPKAYRIS
ncbi:MAG: AraC family transcriptional regulator [Cyanobacteria bacterium P01_B01_bin.77]